MNASAAPRLPQTPHVEKHFTASEAVRDKILAEPV
jgi:hypothetical protein